MPGIWSISGTYSASWAGFSEVSHTNRHEVIASSPQVNLIDMPTLIEIQIIKKPFFLYSSSTCLSITELKKYLPIGHFFSRNSTGVLRCIDMRVDKPVLGGIPISGFAANSYFFRLNRLGGTQAFRTVLADYAHHQ